MKKYLSKQIAFNIDVFDKTDKLKALAELVGLQTCEISSFRLHKQSIDARKKNQPKFVCSYVFESDILPNQNAQPFVEPQNILQNVEKVAVSKKIIVVGSGPCGLFCARYLTQAGHKVTVVERGGDIDQRIEKVKQFQSGGKLDINSNIQFGLGGAGTFSDGKLTSGISSPYTYTVFDEFFQQGAPKEILTSSTPHIGTDFLVKVVANIRNSITSSGGQFLFDTKLVDLIVSSNKISGVCLQNKDNERFSLECDVVVLAVGHSARDTFKMLKDLSVSMTAKPFAVGVRVEHSRQFISSQQYGKLWATHRDLQSAQYKLTANFADGRSCYSFCMCPGGFVVPANNDEKTIVLNGMSNFDRMAKNSNSALVVNVTPKDFGEGLGGVEFQQQLEEIAYTSANKNNDSYKAPCQNVVDFLARKKSTHFDLISSYALGVESVNLWEILPHYVCQSLEKGLLEFGKKITGFDKQGILLAVESRTSSPVKIIRDQQSRQSNVENLFPCGEGAGYAGGIVSAAVDGLKTAIAICTNKN